MTIADTLRTKPFAIAATFPNRSQALTAYDQLRAQGFEHAWLATTTPVDAGGIAASPTIENQSQNHVVDSSEGMLGSIGRFFSGEGNSLRRSLEDHGVDPLDASDIDDGLAPLGAVVTTFGDRRPELAAEILRATATRVYVPPATPLEPTTGDMSTITSRELVDASPVPGIPGAVEEVFIERRIVMPAADGSATKPIGLNDLL
jgi:hypothetical protein